MIRIIIADDHGIVRQGVKQYIALDPKLRLVGDVADGPQLLALLAEQPCDVVILDLSMPGRSGVELIRRIAQLDDAPKILVLSMHNETQLVSRALKAGAAGYLTKGCEPDVLVTAVRKLAKGARYIDPSLVEGLVFDYGLHDHKLPHEVLSDRELEVLRFLVSGLSINEIAAELHLSAKTISTHKMRLMRKMGIQSNAELIRYGVEHDLGGS